ncbi:MAG: hypothetical protein H0Z34_11945 [Brevibacillus sp.]|nr:hypothetical protein [Brevibacillus sp.]
MKRTVLLLLFLLLLSSSAQAETAEEWNIVVKTSSHSSFFSTLTIRDKQGLARQILTCKTALRSSSPEFPRAYVSIGQRAFTFDAMSRLYDQNTGRQILLPGNVSRELEQWVSCLESAHFGKPLSWKKVTKAFPRMAKAIVTDLETGEQFAVQRRAGSRHADVQPLTRADTETMKRIYNGKWSWRRRAILVTIDGVNYAASMHGMPHGAGAIVGNNFPGHFCIHFQDSVTHRRQKPDPSHNLMILKASGKLTQALMEAEAEQLVDYFLLFLREHDFASLRLLADGVTLPLETDRILYLNQVMERSSEQGNNRLTKMLVAEIPVTVSLVEKGSGPRQVNWVFHVGRLSLLDRWRILAVEEE